MKVELTEDQWRNVTSCIQMRMWDIEGTDVFYPGTLVYQTWEELKSINAHIYRSLEDSIEG